jgi:hypothetical protein
LAHPANKAVARAINHLRLAGFSPQLPTRPMFLHANIQGDGEGPPADYAAVDYTLIATRIDPELTFGRSPC